MRHNLHRLYAATVNRRRPCQPYTWPWLNRLAERLFWTNPGAVIRPQYAWGAVFAAAQARALGLNSVALLEFGVAGGRGFLALQQIAEAVCRVTGVSIELHGFDLGSGLPPITDPRDLPQLYKQGDYMMDVPRLSARLKPNAHLIVGNIRDTIHEFVGHPHAPVGFVSFDMDLYTSTVDGLTLFRGAVPLGQCLPRVVCYLDDCMGATFSDLTGERLAVREYNDTHYPQRGIYPVYGLRYHLGWPHNRMQWPSMMYWAHFLDNPRYADYDGLAGAAQAPLA